MNQKNLELARSKFLLDKLTGKLPPQLRRNASKLGKLPPISDGGSRPMSRSSNIIDKEVKNLTEETKAVEDDDQGAEVVQ